MSYCCVVLGGEEANGGENEPEFEEIARGKRTEKKGRGRAEKSKKR